MTRKLEQNLKEFSKINKSILDNIQANSLESEFYKWTSKNWVDENQETKILIEEKFRELRSIYRKVLKQIPKSNEGNLIKNKLYLRYDLLRGDTKLLYF